MNNKYILLVGFLLMLVSCTKKKSLENILVSDCFWDYWNQKETLFINHGYKLKKGGVCYQFDYLFKNNQRGDSLALTFEGDQILPKTWEVLGDTQLVIQGYPLKIHRYNNDTLVLSPVSSKDTILMIRNCKAKSKSDYF